MATMLDNGVRVRWLNTAGFEMVLPGGAHLLVDPWLDSSDVYPFPLEKIERADYILLSHVHFDHAQDIAAILAKFPKARLFVGDLSVDALCREQRVSLTNVYRVRPGEEYQFDDVKINVYAGRHTENARGVYRPAEFDSDVSSLDRLTGWYGSMELQNYLITAADGTRVLVWAGQTTPDQKYRFAGLRPDVACMHLSPKQDPEVFAGLVQAIGAKVVVPHHHDLTEPAAALAPGAHRPDAPAGGQGGLSGGRPVQRGGLRRPLRAGDKRARPHRRHDAAGAPQVVPLRPGVGDARTENAFTLSLLSHFDTARAAADHRSPRCASAPKVKAGIDFSPLLGV